MTSHKLISFMKDFQEILECVTVPENMALLSQSQIKELRSVSQQMMEDRDKKISRLEKDLESLDKSRVVRLESLITEYGKQIAKVQALPKETMTRDLQDECASANLCVLENRQSIMNYITILKTVNLETKKKIDRCFEGYGKEWHQLRYEYLFRKLLFCS
jgi:hypothetical protein